MKALRINEWGQPVQLEDIPQPTAGDGEVLVHVKAASLNPVDSAVAAGYLQQMLTIPMTPGTDFAGDVVAVGADVTHVQPGYAVYGFVPMRGGTFAEYAVVKASEVALKPQSLDYTQAAAVPLVATTAWQALFDSAQLQGGERLLIQGAGGSVGSFAVQAAKNQGAYVIGVAGPQKSSHLHDLGVDEHINYHEQQFEDTTGDIDVVFDTVGGDVTQRSFAVLKPGGRLVTVVGQPSQEAAASAGIQAFGSYAQANSDLLAQIADLIDAGKLRVLVQQVFPLEQAQDAYAALQSGKTPGKIVLAIA